ncbi:hypothetical protein M407DRAFT_71648 [Tulasnella calospora MUT 4182]|uniref:RlpA-like protein double-psi beta-barrel domain-containing protein n=1 Tax=Tulasnella calospora MUT 4182 TaxID=1051891 RepID=A0A0C3L408_9AGAM|nr:hypothetical protein M407DRAFT_71648 [Tulasnella calospora MUT 4182]
MNRGNAHHVSPYTRHTKRGPAKSRRCAAIASSLSIASVSSTSILAKQTHHTTTTTTTKKPKPTQKDDSKDDEKGSSSGGDIHTGDATVYGAGLNACGTVDKTTDMIAAIAHENFDNYPGANGNSNDNPICGKRVEACWQGNCVQVAIHDRCGGCSKDDLDFSPGAFKKLHPNNGRLHGMTWRYL